MGGIAASYISSTSFSVTGDQTTDFNTGRRTRCICSGSYDYGTIVSSSYSDPNTTVVITGDSINSGLTIVYYGVQSGEQGSIPKHDHSSEEGEGGEITLLTLPDTPSEYDDTKYLKSTTSGTEWSSVIKGITDHSELDELDYASSGHTGFAPTSHSHTESDISDLDKYTEAEVDTISGTLQTNIDERIDYGTASGQMTYWNGTKWVKTETSEMVWDDSNKRFGVGTATPAEKLDVVGNAKVSGYITGKKCGVFASLDEPADTTITTAGTYYPILGTFTNDPLEEFGAATADPPGIKYTGTKTQHFEIDWHADGYGDSNDITIHIGIKKNGVLCTRGVMGTFLKFTNEEQALSGTCVLELVTNDEIQLVITSDSNGDILTMHTFTTTITEFFD